MVAARIGTAYVIRCGWSGSRSLVWPKDLVACELLHETRNHADWTNWANDFPEAGINPAVGQDFPNIDIPTKAAVMGIGVVMADLVLCREEREAGTLIAPFPEMVSPSQFGGVCLLGGADKWNMPKVQAFRSWAHNASEADRASVRSLVWIGMQN